MVEEVSDAVGQDRGQARRDYRRARLVRELLRERADALVDFERLAGGSGPTAPAQGPLAAGYAAAQAEVLASLADDRATGEAYCLAHHVTVDGGKRRLMVASLRYLDAFAKASGMWLFSERLLYVDWMDERALS